MMWLLRAISPHASKWVPVAKRCQSTELPALLFIPGCHLRFRFEIFDFAKNRKSEICEIEISRFAISQKSQNEIRKISKREILQNRFARSPTIERLFGAETW